MEVLLSAAAFLILLTVLILIHEVGHFAAARMSGVTVEEFGFGLPPRAGRLFKKGNTLFSLNWIPFGGFVRLKGENAVSQKDRRERGSFASVEIWKRIVILSAGVFMNFVLAVLIFAIGFYVGKWIPSYFTLEDMEESAREGIIDLELGVLISDVVGGGNADKAGVPKESIIAAVNGIPVRAAQDVAEIQSGKSSVIYTVKTGEGWSEERQFTVALKEGKSGIEIVPYPIELEAREFGLAMSVRLAFRETWVVSAMTVKGAGALMISLIKTGRIPEGISGIVGIAQMTHASVQQGWMAYLRLVAILSLSLAVLNILPFPALDGGRLVFVLAEFVGRRPVNRRLELVTNTFGFVFLIFLLVLITYYDVIRLFSE